MINGRRGEPRLNPLQGILLLARFRAEGLGQFGNTVHSFQASLAPLVAFPLVQAGIAAANGQRFGAVLGLAMTMVSVLATPVLSDALARRWSRAESWLRYATALNWCRWVPPVILTLLLQVAAEVLQLGRQPWFTPVSVVVLEAYGVALHWFIARHGLRLTRGRAALFVLLVDLGTAVLAFGPRVAGWAAGYAANGSAG